MFGIGRILRRFTHEAEESTVLAESMIDDGLLTIEETTSLRPVTDTLAESVRGFMILNGTGITKISKKDVFTFNADKQMERVPSNRARTMIFAKIFPCAGAQTCSHWLRGGIGVGIATIGGEGIIFMV